MKLHLKFSCPETRESLTRPDGTLHCDSCKKKIHDFTSASGTELRALIQKKETTCGIFHRTQLSPSFLKSAAAAVLITTSSGCQEDVINPVVNTTIQETIESEFLLGMVVEDMEGSIYYTPEEQPIPIGGYEKFYSVISQAVPHPGNIEGKIFVQFTIDPEGKVSGIEVLRGLNESLDQRVLDILRELDLSFTPGTIAGKPSESRVVIPIRFTSNKGD